MKYEHAILTLSGYEEGDIHVLLNGSMCNLQRGPMTYEEGDIQVLLNESMSSHH